MLGLGLYDAAPFVAFIVELAYGVLCWGVYRGTEASSHSSSSATWQTRPSCHLRFPVPSTTSPVAHCSW